MKLALIVPLKTTDKTRTIVYSTPRQNCRDRQLSSRSHQFQGPRVTPTNPSVSDQSRFLTSSPKNKSKHLHLGFKALTCPYNPILMSPLVCVPQAVPLSPETYLATCLQVTSAQCHHLKEVPPQPKLLKLQPSCPKPSSASMNETTRAPPARRFWPNENETKQKPPKIINQ